MRKASKGVLIFEPLLFQASATEAAKGKEYKEEQIKVFVERRLLTPSKKSKSYGKCVSPLEA
jgi:hypothetical protein